jgi:hypothetical protein
MPLQQVQLKMGSQDLRLLWSLSSPPTPKYPSVPLLGAWSVYPAIQNTKRVVGARKGAQSCRAPQLQIDVARLARKEGGCHKKKTRAATLAGKAAGTTWYSEAQQTTGGLI